MRDTALEEDEETWYHANSTPMMSRMLPLLTPDELAQYKRGRNAHVSAIPKNATHEQYSKATGLECLFGALYLAGKLERINELFILTMEEPHAD